MGRLLTLLSKKKRLSANVWGTALVYDSFNRINNASTLGNTETGQTWEYETTYWYISNNKAYANAQSARVNPGVSDNFEIQADITFNTYAGLIFRAMSATSNNFYLVRMNGTNITLFRVISGTPTSIGSYDITTSVGVTVNLKARVVGTSIDDYPSLSTNQYCGMNAGTDKGVAFDNFRIDPI